MATDFPDYPGAPATSYAQRYVDALGKANSLSVVKAATLNRQPSVREIRANAAAAGSPIPIIYGRVQKGALIGPINYTAGVWTVCLIWCLGEIEAVDTLLINGAAPVSGVTVTHYPGTTSQTADPLLAAAIPGYADTMVASTPAGSIGIAYSVVQYSNSHYDNWPAFVADLRGKKVWNPATATTVYSANPALHLGDLLRSTIYGQGLTVDDTDLETAMDACDEVVTSEARRTAGTVIDTVQDVEQWAEILRAYAACWIVRRGGTAHLIPDKAAASVQTFTASDIVEGSLRVVKQDSSNVPTVVRVKYTDTSAAEWREGDAVAKLSGVDAGTVPWRESVVSMPGVNRYSQAYREAVERLNKLQLADLGTDFETFDEALKREIGDVITLTHFVGLTSKALRITEDPVQVRPGRWRIVASEYDAAAYNSSVENAPSTADGNLPEMGAPGAVTGLTLTESNYQLQNGDYASRIKATWTASSDPFVTSYQVTVRAGGAVIYSATTRDTEATTPPVQELIAHQVDVYALTPLYVGAAASGTITVVGKTAVPSGPASLAGYEVASEVRLAWPADASDFDIRRYEIRYGTTGGSWATADVLDQVDALTYTTRAIPEGTWRFYVNSIDSVGQYGTTPASVDIEVTLDDNAYLAHQETCATGSTTLMVGKLETRGSSTTTYYSDGADTWTSLFGAAAMSTFTADLASYQTMAGTSEWISAAVGVGSSMTGDWLGEVTYTDHSGTATAQLGLSTDNVSYTWGNLSRKGTARYAKIRVQGTGVFSVKVPGPQVSLRVIARETNGSGTSSSGAVTTVDTGVAASDFKSISVIPISDTQYTVSVSNLDTSGATATFDVSIRNTGGSRVAVNFLWATRTV
jgi:hypothetical protein